MFITSDNRQLQDNGILFIPDTSLKLSTSKNFYLISDTKLTSLSAKLNIDDTCSKDIKLYEVPRLSYELKVAVSGVVTSSTTLVNSHQILIQNDETSSQIATSIYNEMLSSGLYGNVTLVDDILTVQPLQSGSNIDNELSNNVVVAGNVTISTTVSRPAEVLAIVDELTLLNVDYFLRDSKHVYKLNVLFEPQFDNGKLFANHKYEHSSKIIVEYDTNVFTSNIKANAVELDPKLVVQLQNFKKFITEDYYQAFFDSKLNLNEQDEVLMNRKRREYLLVMFEMSGFVGAYKSLLAALEYFGWGELLTIKEYWRSMHNDTFKLTDVKNQILDKIEKQLAEYKKTNQMSLTYKINDETGIYDEDGLPIYVNVLADTDTILTKLHALKRVLELDFLTMNTNIIDITGEFSAVVGAELNVWLHNASITTIRLSENINSAIDFEIANQNIYIQEHQVLTNSFGYTVVDELNEKLDFVDPLPEVLTMTAQYFDVLEVLDETSVLEDFDYATKYFRGDFGLIELNMILVDISLYQSFRYILYDFNTNEELFRSRQKTIDELEAGISIGVQRLGEFKVVLALFDNYGGMSVLGSNTKISIANRPINFYIAKHDIEGKYKNLELLSTMETKSNTNASFVVDTISETLDVNDYNQLTNIPAMKVLKNYETKFDMHSTYTQLKQLNSLPVDFLRNIPVEVFGYKYGTIIIDLVGSGIDGMRTFGLKSFEHQSYDMIEQYYDNTYASPELFLQSVIKMLNDKPEESFYRHFTYDINYYSNVPEANISEARPMLRIKAIDKSLTTDNFFIRQPEQLFAHSDFPTSIDKHNIIVFSIIDTMNVIHHNGRNVTGNLNLTLGSRTLSLANKTYSSVDELREVIHNWSLEENVKTISMWKRGEALIISCQEDFSLSHTQFGKHIDVFRGAQGTKIIRVEDGDDIKLAEPVYAFLDDNSKINSANVTWTLRNALTNAIITTQYAQAFRYVITKTGSYTLSCESTDIYGTTITTKNGVYLVNNSTN